MIIENQPFKVKKTYEEVADYLQHQILSGVYKAGERLPSIRELAETLGVGQSTVREAISSLKTIGLLTMRQGEGTFVTRTEPQEVLASFEHIRPMSLNDTIALLEVRKIIETGMVRLAAERRTDEDMAKIEEALAQMTEAVRTGDRWEQADWNFHYALAVSSHNPVLESIMQNLADTISKSLKTSREKLFHKPGSAERLLIEHREIGKAVKQQNPQKAEEAMLLHLRGVEKEMLT